MNIDPFDLGRFFKETSDPEDFETLNDEYKRIWDEVSYQEDINLDLALKKELWPSETEDD